MSDQSQYVSIPVMVTPEFNWHVSSRYVDLGPIADLEYSHLYYYKQMWITVFTHITGYCWERADDIYEFAYSNYVDLDSNVPGIYVIVTPEQGKDLQIVGISPEGYDHCNQDQDVIKQRLEHLQREYNLRHGCDSQHTEDANNLVPIDDCEQWIQAKEQDPKQLLKQAIHAAVEQEDFNYAIVLAETARKTTKSGGGFIG